MSYFWLKNIVQNHTKNRLGKQTELMTPYDQLYSVQISYLLSVSDPLYSMNKLYVYVTYVFVCKEGKISFFEITDNAACSKQK